MSATQSGCVREENFPTTGHDKCILPTQYCGQISTLNNLHHPAIRGDRFAVLFKGKLYRPKAICILYPVNFILVQIQTNTVCTIADNLDLMCHINKPNLCSEDH